jgi:hypothetical protein
MSHKLARFPSASNPAKFYDIIEGDDGVVYCTCMGWKTSNPHMCKHLAYFKVQSRAHRGIPQDAPLKPGLDPLSQAIDEAVRSLK